ncbi:MAG: two-component regulator propeller domain-containing protein, partial [Bacteroidales bacterium]|nr:two-component regulator propeller domain-containing protein [Bacteroidales bacterium]
QNKSFNNLNVFQGKIYTNYHNYEAESSDTMLVFDNGNWQKFLPEYNDIVSINSNSERLVVLTKYWAKIFDEDVNEIRHIWRYKINDVDYGPMPQNAAYDTKGNLWIADKRYGLVYNPEDWICSSYVINGPDHYEVFDFAAIESGIIAVKGGMNLSWGPLWNAGAFAKFSNNLWYTHTQSNTSGLAGIYDLVRVVVDPNDPTHFFMGSWVKGLVEFRNNQHYKTHNPTNSTLTFVEGTIYCRIGGMAFDEDGNLWVTNSLTSPQIHVLSPEGNWTSIDYSSYIGGINIGRFIITEDDVKWVILPQSVGLFVFDDNNTPADKSDDKVKKLSVINEEGEVISNDVFSIAQDKNGYIWVGTSKGVAVYYNPEDVFETGNLQARQIKIPRNDGTDNADILLGNDVVTSINVDGADKKWFGTQNGGVYYTSADGLEEIHHFTRDNSPLLSNNILCTAIIPNTGEVFFGTAAGIISYRSTATEGGEDYIGVYAFPNPVKPDYRGPITITGLVAGSYVKITDISGNLVTEMRSEGGQAVWYGEDLNGNRVSTGVYLVFSSNETGSKTDITKILFINGNE